MINLKEKVDLNGFTLIIPSVAVGNVGQLAVDLLISSSGLRRIGSVLNSAFIPVVGPDPYNQTSNDICTTVDVYIQEQSKIVIFQIRSLLTKKPQEFFDDLCCFVKDQKIGKVVILTSSYDQEKRDEQIRTTPLRYVSTEKLKLEYKAFFETKSWLQLENKVVDFVQSSNLQIPGGGFAIDLFETFESANIDCIILIKFCSEGDNIPDALSLLGYLNQFVQVVETENGSMKVRYPFSWKYLFGNSPPVEIY